MSGFNHCRAGLDRLYCYGARWYEPYLNRWTQPDPIIPSPGNPLDWDRYSYVRNNPVKYNDPSGHEACDEDGNCYNGNGTRKAAKTGTPLPYLGIGFNETYVKILIAIAAMESTSGWVPDYVNYMKTWSLLNLRSSHQSAGYEYTPFEDWKNSERPTLDSQQIKGTVEEQINKLLIYYEKCASGNCSIPPNAFAKITSTVIAAGQSWQANGRNSVADPVHGATGFKDASGLYYPNGKVTDREHLGENPNYQNIIADKDQMSTFQSKFQQNLAYSGVYQIGVNAYSDPVYTFTVFYVGDY